MCCISVGAHVKNRIVECDIIMHNKSFLHMTTLVIFSSLIIIYHHFFFFYFIEVYVALEKLS